MAKKVKLVFSEDKYITEVDKKDKVGKRVKFASKGEAVEVEESSVTRWLKRGGKLYDAKAKAAVEDLAPVIEEVDEASVYDENQTEFLADSE